MEIKGKVKSIGAIESFGDKDFKVVKFRLDLTRFNQDTGEEYPNEAEFQLTGKRTDQVETFAVGDKIEFKFNIKGREVEKKDKSGMVFIQNLEAFNITVLEKGGVAINASSTGHVDLSGKPAEAPDDDLPF